MSNSNYSNRGLNVLEEFSSDMERVFDSLLGRTVGTALRSSQAAKFVPSLDVTESAEDFLISIDLPGVKPADVKVEMHEGKLTISGSRESTTEDKEKNYHRVERTSGSFFRSIAVPSEVDVERIDASYEHGVLHVKLPKSAKQQPKKIEIRTQG
ncbi:MAG: Hsp20/alpha crystallin family protein [Pirellulaceae bacterium]